MIKKTHQQLYIFLILFFLYTPLLVLVCYSFNDAKYSLHWQHFSWRWFIALAQDNVLLESLKNSLFLALASSLLTCMIAVFSCTSLLLNRARKTLKYFLILPSFLIILPDLILGLGFLIMFNLFHISFGFTSLLIAHVTFSLPFIIFTIISKLQGFNINLYFVALDLGASKSFAWRKIIIPLILPSVITAFLLGFILSFDDVIISYFVAGPEFNILPLTILGMIRSGASPELNALCSITLLISLVIISLTQIGLRKNL